VQHHYEEHWKGWALKIKTFLGPEMARAKRVPFGLKKVPDPDRDPQECVLSIMRIVTLWENRCLNSASKPKEAGFKIYCWQVFRLLLYLLLNRADSYLKKLTENEETQILIVFYVIYILLLVGVPAAAVPAAQQG
jgi:hypothetical protein